jgi:poly(hydroxyalkanoate) depolymerase family esterase
VEAREAPAGRFVSGRHSAGGAMRDYKLYVPPAAGSRPLPLVVMLHGCTQNPDDFAAGTAMNELAQAQGFYVLYPAQSRQANPQACWNWFKHTHQQRGRGEPALLAGMTREVMAQHAIDPGRVYVAGLSAGGAMAAILAATYPDLYAAVGVHSGLAAGAAGDLPSALSAMKGGRAGNGATVHGVPTIVFHGDADATVHPANGEHVIKASAGAACTIETQRVPQGRARASTKSIYTEAGSGRVVAEHWLIHGTAHAWSGGRSQGSYTDSRGPDASAEMLRFFLEHPRQ